MKIMVARLLVLLLPILVAAESSASYQNYIPSVYPGTGPYERVYSDTGYSYMSASVYLPGTPQVSIPISSTDTAYVYTGGWGANGAGATDAGFQYSPTYNDWSLFAADGVQSLAYGDRTTRFAAGQTLSLTFAVIQAGANVDIVVTAVGIEVNTTTVVTESLTLVNDPGWSVGGANTLKRMTSIAQKGDNFTDGNSISGVGWSNVTLGQTVGDAVAWTGGGSQSYPGTPGIVNVNYVNSANQTDSINLSPQVVPEPASWALCATGQILGLGYWWRRGRGRRLAVASPT